MMNKIINLRHIAVIISVIIIAIGMAVGTIFHFVSNGFFNYGNEFASYKTVELTTSVPEDAHGEYIQQVANDVVAPYGAYEVVFSQGQSITPNTVVCKFDISASDEDLAAAVSAAQSALTDMGIEESTVQKFVIQPSPEGRDQVMFLSIALASAVVLQAIYTAIRLKPGMALAGLCTQVASLGLYLALLAITRCPVGLEAISFAIIPVVLAAACTTFMFGKIKRAFKDDANEKIGNHQLIADVAGSTLKVNFFACVAAVVAVLLFGLFAIISLPAVSVLMPYASALLAVLSALCGLCLFAPACYALFSAIDRKNNK